MHITWIIYNLNIFSFKQQNALPEPSEVNANINAIYIYTSIAPSTRQDLTINNLKVSLEECLNF